MKRTINLRQAGAVAFGIFCVGAICHGESFSVVALPDTQNYSRFRESSSYLGHENPYFTQVEWIVDNTEPRDIAFTAHLGDVVDQAWVPEQWSHADSAHKVLDDAGLNYGVARGNHDVSSETPDPFLEYFGPQRFAGMPTYRGSDSYGYSSYHTFVRGDREFLVLFTDWRNDATEMAWARSVLDANPDKPTILVSHQVITPGSGTPPAPEITANGQELWDELIETSDQVFMTLNGHHQGALHMAQTNAFGNEVIHVLSDFQNTPYSGAGYLLELEFDLQSNRISGSTYSPWLTSVIDAGLTIPSFFSLPEYNTTPGATFTYSLDFDQRFGPAIPEPCGLGLLAAGGLAAICRRRRS